MLYKTDQRSLLLEFLQNNPDEMFSEKQIEEKLLSDGISRSSLYRNLVALESEGEIKRCAKNGSREIFFQYLGNQNCKTHIHMSCKNCGKIFHMENEIAAILESELSKLQGFQIIRGETTVYGTCKNCMVLS